MRSLRIVVADPDAIFRQGCISLLELHGHVVVGAASLDDVHQLLEAGWFHLIILSVQMENPDDPEDQSGVVFAQNNRATPKIMVSRFASLDLIREIMRMGRSNPIAIDFLQKDEVERIAEFVERAVNEAIQINWDLRIRLTSGLSFLYLVQMIIPDADPQKLFDYSLELEDLFRTVFYNHKQITLNQVVSQDVTPIVIEVFVYHESVEERLAVIIDRQSEDIRFVSSSVRFEETPHFRLVSISLSHSEKLVTFRKWFPLQTPDEIRKLLNTLVQRVAVTNGEVEERSSNDFRQFYLSALGLKKDEEPPYLLLDETIKSICQQSASIGSTQLIHGGRKLTLRSDDGTESNYLNPAFYPIELMASSIPFGPVYDHLSVRMVFGSAEGGIQILPSFASRIGPIPHSLAAFELSLHLALGSDLPDCFEIENYLLNQIKVETVTDFDQFPAEVQQAAFINNVLREIAKVDPQSYSVALFFVALSRIAAYDPAVRYTPAEIAEFVHVLLIAAMLCQRESRLDPLPVEAPDHARNTLWIEPKTRRIWVESIQVMVTPQEFNILNCLNAHIGDPCSREDLLKAMGDNSGSLALGQGKLDNAMSRLRKKIERDPNNPRYLQTIRNYGYQLNLVP